MKRRRVIDHTKNLLKSLFPPFCTLCQQKIVIEEYENLCQKCCLDIILANRKCIFCDTPGAFLCHLCKKESPKLQNIFVCFNYESTIRKIIQQFKYSLRPYLARTLNQLIWQRSLNFFAQLPIDTTIIPMPSGRLRVAKRGYNPVSEVARHLSQRSELPYCDNYLKKRAFSIPQTDLKRADRLTNLQNHFLKNHQILPPLQQRSLLIIDDVVTTGRSFKQLLESVDNPHTEELYGLFIAQS